MFEILYVEITQTIKTSTKEQWNKFVTSDIDGPLIVRQVVVHDHKDS